MNGQWFIEIAEMLKLVRATLRSPRNSASLPNNLELLMRQLGLRRNTNAPMAVPVFVRTESKTVSSGRFRGEL